MREIISLQVGRCGNQVGQKFWEMMSDEHGISCDGQYCGQSDLQCQRLNVYYNESECGRFVPRAVLVDCDIHGLVNVRATQYGKLFRPDNFIFGYSGAANNWAKGYHTDGAVLADCALDIVRREAEECDCLQGLQLVHSVAGGTGGGLGSRLLDYLRDEYPDRMIVSCSVLTSPLVSGVVVEPYNSVLTMRHLLENTDMTICFDNESLQSICQKTVKLSCFTPADMNNLIAITMSGITTCLRFPGQLNSDLRKLAVNMTPFPRLHFDIPGFVPLMPCGVLPYQTPSVHHLIRQIFHPGSMMAACDPRYGQYLTAAAVFRGMLSTQQIDEHMAYVQQRNPQYFVPWLPNNISTTICDIPPRGLKVCATFLGNNTCITQSLTRALENYSQLYKRKAFLHWYLGEGMEESVFEESEEMILDLVAEYLSYENLEEEPGPYPHYRGMFDNVQLGGDKGKVKKKGSKDSLGSRGSGGMNDRGNKLPPITDDLKKERRGSKEGQGEEGRKSQDDVGHTGGKDRDVGHTGKDRDVGHTGQDRDEGSEGRLRDQTSHSNGQMTEQTKSLNEQTKSTSEHTQPTSEHRKSLTEQTKSLSDHTKPLTAKTKPANCSDELVSGSVASDQHFTTPSNSEAEKVKEEAVVAASDPPNHEDPAEPTETAAAEAAAAAAVLQNIAVGEIANTNNASKNENNKTSNPSLNNNSNIREDEDLNQVLYEKRIDSKNSKSDSVS